MPSSRSNIGMVMQESLENPGSSLHVAAASREGRRMSLSCSELEAAEAELNFQGFEGATSLKAEISGRIPNLNDSSAYREARCLLLKLGGAEALLRELVFAGFVDLETELLSIADRPFNVFAHLAQGAMTQPTMEKDQQALGSYRSKFHICANRLENDLHWDSENPVWIPKASMGHRHRLLTTKNLHWQWFNALVFGLVPGGVSPRDALVEVQEMKAAALHYAKNAGWSDDVGLFVNVFGHNNVNSLFVHVLDMAELGPGFEYHFHKNCPLDAVLKVLREEAVQKLIPSPPRSITVVPGLRGSIISTRAFFFNGTEGATSLKEEIVARLPQIKDSSGYRQARKLLLNELGGWEALYEELSRSGFVDPETHELTTETAPLNVFARIAAGKMSQPDFQAQQELLGDYKQKFIICSNRPENDVHWDSEDVEWVGKASMSRRHKLLIIKDLHWQWFNALIFGLVPEKQGGLPTKVVVSTLEVMKAAALTYTKNAGWGGNTGLFVHVFGHNSVNSLHLHILDMSELGPTFWKLDRRNCPLDAVIQVLHEEMASVANGSADPLDNMARSAAEAATSAKETMAAVTSMVRRLSQENIAKPSDHKLGVVEAHDIMQLNVGGESVDVHRDTLLLAPQGSMLNAMFSSGWTSPQLVRDSNGRIFLDLPPTSFKTIVDHLRLLHSTSPEEILTPPVVLRQHCREFEDLAWMLGVCELVTQPNSGRAKGMPRRVGERPRACVEPPQSACCSCS